MHNNHSSGSIAPCMPDQATQCTRQVLIVTGMSGAGKNVVMRALEDVGFYCVDNLPLPLMSTFLAFVFQSRTNVVKLAFGIDARGERFSKNFLNELQKLRRRGGGEFAFTMIFLKASNETLLKRFQETRRRHPLARVSDSIRSAIEKERTLLEPLVSTADIVLDTDSLNMYELRKWVNTTLSGEVNGGIVVNLLSFGFKYGLPVESNMVYDLRFLPNPYFIPALKAQSGLSTSVQSYLFEQEDVEAYWQRLLEFLRYSIQKYYQEGRLFVNIALGCTGGYHRSVAFVERLAQQRWDNVTLVAHHRDVNKKLS